MLLKGYEWRSYNAILLSFISWRKALKSKEMGFEISVAAGLVSLHLCYFTPHTSHLARGNRKLYGAFWDQEASFVWRIFFQLSITQWTGVGGVCSENCKENHQLSLPSSDAADTSVVVFPPHYSKSVQKILQDLETVELYSIQPALSMKYIELLRTNCQFNFTLGDWTDRFVLAWPGLAWPGLVSPPSVCFKSLKVSDCKCRIMSYHCAITAVWGITGRLHWTIVYLSRRSLWLSHVGLLGAGGRSVIQLWCYNSIWGCSFPASQLLQLLSAFIFIKLLTN